MTTFELQPKAGIGWLYNDSGLVYNAATHPVTNSPLYYNASGQLTSFTLVNKS